MSGEATVRYFIVLGAVLLGAFVGYCLSLLDGSEVAHAAGLTSLATLIGVAGAIGAAWIASAPVRAQLRENQFQSVLASRPLLIDWVQNNRGRRDVFNSAYQTHIGNRFGHFFFEGIQSETEAFSAEQDVRAYVNALTNQGLDGLDQMETERVRNKAIKTATVFADTLRDYHYPVSSAYLDEASPAQIDEWKTRARTAHTEMHDLFIIVMSDYAQLLAAFDADARSASTRIQRIDRMISGRD